MQEFIQNRKARFNYFLINIYKAGIVLCGSEVKSIRAHKVNISEAFCYFNKGELYLKNAHITSENDIMFSHNEIADRKLLLRKSELRKLQKATAIKGLTIVPVYIEINNPGYIKVHIALAKGKHDYDKRNSIKERDLNKDLKR